jgi:hypothetical protein
MYSYIDSNKETIYLFQLFRGNDLVVKKNPKFTNKKKRNEKKGAYRCLQDRSDHPVQT